MKKSEMPKPISVPESQPEGGLRTPEEAKRDTPYVQALVYLEPWEDPAEAKVDFTHLYEPSLVDELRELVDSNPYGGTVEELVFEARTSVSLRTIKETTELYHTPGDANR